MASAYDAQVDGVYYNLITKAKQAEVTSGDTKYTGNVTIPESFTYNGVTYSVTSIGNGAFYYCSGLTSVTIPNSVTSIGNGAFYYCSGLTSVTIGKSVTSIGENAFSDCYGLTSVHITDIAAWCKISFFSSSSNPLYYAHHLFMDGKEITDLVIPNSVTSIGEAAFRGCSGLTSVTIPNSVASIGSYAFDGCSGLTSVTIPNSVTSIGNGAFYYCSGLTSVTIGNSVKSIGDCAFSGCSKLTSITIPNSVKSIGYGAFWDCSGLTFVTIPNSVTSIGYNAFRECSGLTSVTIPNSVTSIGESAFYGCSGLTSVTIGSGVENISNSAFASCSELADVYCYAENVPSTSSDAFKDSYVDYATLYVPEASVAAYKATAPWSGFGTLKALNASADAVDMNSSDITINLISAVTYNGLAQIPTVTVKYGNTTLTEGTDYTVSYSDNTNAGTATVTITGMGNYIGTRTANFTINKAPLTITANSYTISKGDALPAFAVSYSGFKNGETESVLTTLPTITCDATDSETAGAFDIKPSGAEAQNYDITYVAGTITIKGTTPSVDYAYVDLGLPSGIKWANMNVGANAIEDAGLKFAWGETSTKEEFTEENYKFGSSASSLTKYNKTDGLTVLQAEDDAATANMGAGWRIPTLEEWKELRDNCTRQWTTVNGIYGYRFTGSNGNSIFLPVWIATSWMGGAGAYWTSTLGSDICTAFDIDFDGGGFYIDDNIACDLPRSVARNVRAVYDNQTPTQARDSEGFKYIYDFTYVSNISDYEGSGGNYHLTNCTQHEDGNIIKANIFCVENFYGVSEGQSWANMNVFADKDLTTKLGEFNFCWGWYLVSIYGENDELEFSFTEAYNTMEIGESKQLTYSDGTVYTFTLLDKIVSSINSEKKLVFSVDRPLYFGGNKNGSAGIERFSNRVQIKYIPKCATPTIAFVDGKVTFDCETEGVEYVAKVVCTTSGDGDYEASSIPLTTIYTVTVYATKDGYYNSDEATLEINVGGGTSGLRGDVNNDGQVSMPDAMFIVNKILNGKFPDE